MIYILNDLLHVSPDTYRTTNFATLAKINKSGQSPIIINVCIHWRTVLVRYCHFGVSPVNYYDYILILKTSSCAKYVFLLKYRDYYKMVVSCFCQILCFLEDQHIHRLRIQISY